VTNTVIRCALAAVALLAGAWLVLSLRAIELEAEGSAIVEQGRSRTLTPDEFERGQSALRRARRLNADNAPLLQEGLLLGHRRRFEQWLALAGRATADEPENFDVWYYTYLAAIAAGDPERATQAFRKMRALNPLAAQHYPRPRSGS
jgi:hypothetical protein